MLGSRDAARAVEAAAEVQARLATFEASEVTGAANLDAAETCEVAVIAVPYAAHRDTLEALTSPLAGKLVIDAVVPVRFERGPHPVAVPEGSAAQQAAVLLPASRVAGAFQTVAAEALLDPTHALAEDVLVTGDSAEVRRETIALVDSLAGLRGVDAGPLRFSRMVEGITLLLIGVNGRYKTHSGIRVTGLAESTEETR